MNVFSLIKNTVKTCVNHIHKTYEPKEVEEPKQILYTREDVIPSSLTEEEKRQQILQYSIESEKSDCRIKIINQIHEYCEKEDIGWQNIPTPLRICESMADLLPITDDMNYVVLFNLEFLEVLIRQKGVSLSKILYVADNDIRFNAAKKIYDVENRILFTRENSLDNFPAEEIKKRLEKEGNEFCVVGNPPYQKPDGGGHKNSKSAQALYSEFINKAKSLKPDYLTFIVPAKWRTGEGKGKNWKEFCHSMNTDPHMKYIKIFPESKMVFSDAGDAISGGVCYFLRDKNNKYNTIIEIVGDENVGSIETKVKSIHKNEWMNQKVLSQNPFGIRSNFSNWTEEGIPCLIKGKETHFVSIDDVKDKYNIIDKWKVCVSKANGAAQICDKNGQKNVLTDIFVLSPRRVCSETYLVLNSFDTQEEAENFMSYVETKFFRYMLSTNLIGHNISKERLCNVPDLQDYTKPWTDQELYDMSGLSQDEIDYIENKIKPLN